MIKQYITAVLIFLSFGLTAANRQGSAYFQIVEFQRVNNSLIVSMNVTLQGKIADDCQGIAYIPSVSNGSNERAMPYFLVIGSNKKKMFNRWNKLRGQDELYTYSTLYNQFDSTDELNQTISYRAEIPYESWMDEADLIMREELYDCNNKLYITQYSIRNNYKPIVIPEQPQVVIPQRETREKRFEIYFPWDVYDVRMDIRDNYRVLNQIKDLLGKGNTTVEEIRLTGYASPEGTYSYNDNLSRNRANEVKRTLQRSYDLPDNIFRVTWVPENWSELASMVRDGNISGKNEILNIINNDNINIDQRDSRIRAIDNGRTYERLLNDYYPLLRKVECVIYYAQ